LHVELLKFGEASVACNVVIPSEAKQQCLERVETVRVGRKDKRQSRPQTGNGQ
jgi:hypothetical protein